MGTAAITLTPIGPVLAAHRPTARAAAAAYLYASSREATTRPQEEAPSAPPTCPRGVAGTCKPGPITGRCIICGRQASAGLQACYQCLNGPSQPSRRCRVCQARMSAQSSHDCFSNCRCIDCRENAATPGSARCAYCRQQSEARSRYGRR